MRKNSLLFLLSVCSIMLHAQTYVTIPDANFVSWLQANVPAAMNANQMDITHPAVTTRTNVTVEDKGIADITGIEYFTGLKVLDCGNGFAPVNPNSISFLPALPSALDSLVCGGNILTSLPALPSTLKLLKCYENNLSSMPALPAGLLYLDCSINPIGTLPALPATLTYLRCGHNQLSVLPALPSGLKYLSFFDNPSISIPVLPNSITQLFCNHCGLTVLPALPPALELLGCNNNQLTSLPSLPNTIKEMECHDNPLGSLPALPLSLTILLCMNNQLAALPSLPNTLSFLWCSDNQITHLPVLPSSLVVLNCANNSISCFDPFGSQLGSIDISGNPFNCLPNYIPVMDAGTLSYPICLPGNSSGCPAAKGVFGFAYKDNNSSCVKEAGDAGLKNIPVQLYNNTGNFLSQTYTAINGAFHLQPPTGSSAQYTVVVDSFIKDYEPTCFPPGIDSTFQHTLLDTNINFALTCKSGFDVGVQSVFTKGLVFPGQTHSLTVNAGDLSQWYGLNCGSGISGSITFTVNGPVVYAGPAAGALTPLVTGNVYSYTIPDFGMINNAGDMSLVFTTNPAAQAGDQVCVSVEVLPVSGDRNPANNIVQYCYSVVNSYDPNIKEVYPVQVTPNFNDWLIYTIHFQNTGNAAAINIRLEDVLDTKLDLRTFEVMNYSHANVIDLSGNKLNIRFPDIMLADSTSDPIGSIGFIQYRIKPKNNWVSDTIRNSASIYFDFNTPIVTNIAKTYFMTATGLQNSTVSNAVVLYPNPANYYINIISEQFIQSIEVSNIAGQVLLSKTVNENKCVVQLNDFTEGIYFVKVKHTNGLQLTRKVVVNR